MLYPGYKISPGNQTFLEDSMHQTTTVMVQLDKVGASNNSYISQLSTCKYSCSCLCLTTVYIHKHSSQAVA